MPPSLTEIEEGGAFSGGIRNLNFVSKQTLEEEAKLREYLFKWELIRNANKDKAAELPKFTIHNKLDQVVSAYDDWNRKTQIPIVINRYRKWLIGSFHAIQWLAPTIGLDMTGFVEQQKEEMDEYEKLLIELGEKSWMPKSSWPVELRIVLAVLGSALSFAAQKMVIDSIMGGEAKPGQARAPITPPKPQNISKPMPKPSIKLADLPGAKKQEEKKILSQDGKTNSSAQRPEGTVQEGKTNPPAVEEKKNDLDKKPSIPVKRP
jgi:hypothetical protein